MANGHGNKAKCKERVKNWANMTYIQKDSSQRVHKSHARVGAPPAGCTGQLVEPGVARLHEVCPFGGHVWRCCRHRDSG